MININFCILAKKSGLKGNARTLIWIHSLREKAVELETMLHKLQTLTIALKRKQQLGVSKKPNYSAIAVATAVVTKVTSFSSSVESSNSTKR